MPFAVLTEETLNPAYFAEVGKRIRYANEKGITIGVVLAWTDKGQSTQSWQKFRDQAARLRYARYAVSRFSAYNVYFIVAGEWDSVRSGDEAARLIYNEIGTQVKADDAHRRMVGIHSNAHQPPRIMPFAGSAWNDFGDYQQNYGKIHQAVVEACTASHGPVINSEYGYYRRTNAKDGTISKANSANVDIMRAATWDIVMGGGYFVTGFGSTYFGGNRTLGKFDPDAPQNRDWEEQIQHIRAFFTALPWWNLEPHDEAITAPVPRGDDEGVKSDTAGRPPRVTYWALAQPDNKRYVAYVRRGVGAANQPCQLTLQNAPANAAYRVRRFDPRTGVYADLPAPPPTGSVVSLSPPDEQDFVFLVEAA